MRSIASQWRHEDQREPLADDTDALADDGGTTSVNEFADLTECMRSALREDTPALGIFERTPCPNQPQGCAQPTRHRRNGLRHSPAPDDPYPTTPVQTRMDLMTTPRDPDQLLSLIAEGILEASDDEIIAAAQAHGLDVVALERRVREIIATRIEAAQSSPAPNFQIGHTVSLRSDPARIGVITGITPSNRETRLNVFIDGRLETWYLSQVIAADLTPGAVRATLDEFSARLTALQLAEPSIANLYSLQAGQIDFIPYQFRPVLKFVRADRPRMLVADEVGVGKTIEAGLLLRELQARRPLRSVLIVCSKALVVEEKWHREMRRFDEEFVTLGSDDLRYCLRPERSRRRMARPLFARHPALLLGQREPAPRLCTTRRRTWPRPEYSRRTASLRPADRRRGAQRAQQRYQPASRLAAARGQCRGGGAHYRDAGPAGDR